MGEEIDRTEFTAAERRRFEGALAEEVALFARTARTGGLARAGFVVGFEVEAWLVDHGLVPAPINAKLLAALNDPMVVPELSRFNVELNGTPRRLEAGALSVIAEELDATWRKCLHVSHAMDATLVLIGILPTIRQSDLTIENVSTPRRYAALNEMILEERGGRPIVLDIDSEEALHVEHRDVMLEAATTSFQVHLQVPAEAMVRVYNASLVASGPLLAAGTNSPFLFGHTLWHETRVPLFEQATATHRRGTPREDRRVTFGSGFLRESVAEYFEDVVARFPVLLPLERDPDPAQFSHLRLHNGTVWNWNRPLIGFDDDGTPHVRVEQRVLPAGPSLPDMVANAAFWIGLVSTLSTLERPPEADVPFMSAREGFEDAARRGLDAQVVWLDGRRHPVRDLLLEEAIPAARLGLRLHGLSEAEVEYWIGIVEQRVRSRVTGSEWQRTWIQKHGRDFQRMLAAYLENQRSGAPVHEWPA